MNKRSPAAIPIGTVVANDTIINGRSVLELVGSVAIRVPRERPSNNWWNVTAVRREAGAGIVVRSRSEESRMSTPTEF